MPLGALLGAAIFVTWSLVLGARLLEMARRTRGLPELAMGTAFVASGGVGFALQIAAQTPDLLSPLASARAMAAGKLCVQLGVGCQALFTWRVFRPDRAWAARWFAAVVVSLAAISAGYAASGHLGDPVYSGVWFWLESLAQMIATGWGAAEALRFHRLMRRRLRLGLADPVVTNRFLVWGVAIGAGVLAIAVGPLIHAIGVESPCTPYLLGLAGAVAVTSALGYWLTFFPPASYRHLVVRRAEALRV
jgi:hypothetical protein